MRQTKCALRVEILDGRLTHHRKAELQLCKIFSAKHLVWRSGTPGHDSRFYQIRLLFALVINSTIMGKQTGRKRSESATMRYLDSLHGKVPVLRAGGETYLWMPAPSGGQNVWRHVLTRGTSPGSARKRIALKAGNSTNSALQSAKNKPGNNSSSYLAKSNASLKNWVN
jgi:hypothetical protein